MRWVMDGRVDEKMGKISRLYYSMPARVVS